MILGVLCLVSLWANFSADRVSEQVFILDEAPAVKVMDQLDERYGTAISMRRHETMNGFYVVAPREVLAEVVQDIPQLEQAKPGPVVARYFLEPMSRAEQLQRELECEVSWALVFPVVGLRGVGTNFSPTNLWF